MIMTQHTPSFSFPLPPLMAILNITPDSFSGDGISLCDTRFILKNISSLVKQGITFLDIGGESTRPGAEKVSTKEEIQRVIPLISSIRNTFPDVILSLDSYKPDVAKEGLEHGVHILNDIQGGRDKNMLDLAKEYKCPIILMHNKAQENSITFNTHVGYSYNAPQEHLIKDTEREVQSDNAPQKYPQKYSSSPPPEAFIKTFTEEMKCIAQKALNHGLSPHQIILDPGLGFGKTVEQNYLIINHLQALKKELPYRFLIGASRKSFLGHYTQTPPQERDTASAIFHFEALKQGADIIRVHNTQAARDSLSMYKAFQQDASIL